MALLIDLSQDAQLGLLFANKAFSKIPTEYSQYTDVFSPNLVIELPEYISMNDNAIEQKKGNQSLYGLIYSLSLIELEKLKTYIKSHLIPRLFNFLNFQQEHLSFLTENRIEVSIFASIRKISTI